MTGRGPWPRVKNKIEMPGRAVHGILAPNEIPQFKIERTRFDKSDHAVFWARWC